MISKFKVLRSDFEIFNDLNTSTFCKYRVFYFSHSTPKLVAIIIYNVLEPRGMWEMVGQVPHLVFPTGLIVDSVDDRGFTNPSSIIKLYYGAADTHIGLATCMVQELIDSCFP